MFGFYNIDVTVRDVNNNPVAEGTLVNFTIADNPSIANVSIEQIKTTDATTGLATNTLQYSLSDAGDTITLRIQVDTTVGSDPITKDLVIILAAP